MIDEVDDILYQWKQGYISRDMAEQKIIDAVLSYQVAQHERQRSERAAVDENRQ